MKILEFLKKVFILMGLVFMVVIWLIVFLFLLIYDAIFGGWDEKTPTR